MDLLKTHDIQMTTHHWKEEDWNTSLICFFTNIFPKNIPLEHESNDCRTCQEEQDANISCKDHPRAIKIAIRTSQNKSLCLRSQDKSSQTGHGDREEYLRSRSFSSISNEFSSSKGVRESNSVCPGQKRKHLSNYDQLCVRRVLFQAWRKDLIAGRVLEGL